MGGKHTASTPSLVAITSNEIFLSGLKISIAGNVDPVIARILPLFGLPGQAGKDSQNAHIVNVIH